MAPRTLVLGIGNVLWADEGFGVRCVERLAEGWSFGPQVQLLDGGTQGLYLLHHVQDAEALIVFDAVDYGLPPGTLKIVEGDDVPAFMGAKKMSLHQTGFQEVLAAAQFTGRYPDTVLLIGCQPEELEDYGGGLRAAVAARIPQALDIALDRLRALGHDPRPEPAPEAAQADALAAPALRMDAYEGGRPSAEAACRTGDDRFLPSTLPHPSVGETA
ncbi:HyaD/HybD family hydrogenase maturation endopeptidase [Albimonas sp. CAU 1670]|uniref:HyaD/HybD family hydrogenase maturation endopeptidase n=1 Tax=Albimonas sp. CAU 1670 TaxID=3032599 RepID=UPI0023DC78C3|nr:HyaD/HybD family hydrogenase maturation endopeptidase [Albimonas sp. CAU 1670]MDF2235643.1 HyaD/HybD family hydrogenase maturation endopeptidase [Albimonas sp. CAU 1670]